MKYIDEFLNNITMYRLLLYYLIALLIFAVVFSVLSILPFTVLALIISTLFLLAVSLITNGIFASVYEAHTNVESVYITALILALIISPAKNLHDLVFLGWAALLATAGKYILAIGKKHIFNPVAISVVLTSVVLGDSATWWVGNPWMLPIVATGGILVVRKIWRADMFFSFLVTTFIMISVGSFMKGADLFATLGRSYFGFPILFFGFVMLTEPLTTPPTDTLQIVYGTIVGILISPTVHFGSFYTTPEIALVLGNIFSYIVSPKEKLMLQLKEKLALGQNIYDFLFVPDKRFAYIPGQYMEWTLGHEHTDDRGNRRYFTLASSPTEPTVRLGIRFADNASSFKKSMLAMTPGSKIFAGQRAGDFVLPASQSQKLVFIAGGIGITPYRSMIKYILDTNQKHDIVLFYSNKWASEIVYKDLFDTAESLIGMKTIYSLTDRERIPAGWTGKVGRIDARLIAAEVPDFRERIFYLSGPNAMVDGFRKVLSEMGIPGHQIKTDFFPGFM